MTFRATPIVVLFSQACLHPIAAALPPTPKPVICIDPGHPSEINDGYQKQNGTTETHINWQVAQRLRTLLLNVGYRVVMTKQSENQLVLNVRRAEIANRAKVSLMLRLHCDTGAGTGFRIFYPDRAARDGKVTGPPPTVQRASASAAEAIHGALVDALAADLKDNGVATDRSTAVGKKMGGALIGSIHSKVPVVLVEMVFLNNPKDAAFIKSDVGQQQFAKALAAGVESLSR
jgi:N-acetylmuramoyl-L-alanine amidase